MKSLRDNWNKLKKLAPKLLEYGKDNDSLRNNLVRGAGHIFAHFEAQFMNVSSPSGWEYAIRKIVNDAVHRVLSYLRNSDIGIELDAITKGLILGESKRHSNAWGMPNLHKGHTINLHGEDLRTKDLYKNLGVKYKNKYYVPNNKKEQLSLDSGGWFRLAFEWESISVNDMNELPKAPRDPYQYSLSGTVLEEKLETIKRIVDEEESHEVMTEIDEIKKDAKAYAERMIKILERNNDAIMLTLNNFKKELEGLKETSVTTEKTTRATLDTANEIKALTLEIRAKINQAEKMQDAEKPIWTVKKPVPSFEGRKQELANLHELVLRETKSSYLSAVTVICGLGGIGKTQLARQCAHDLREAFCNVVWLDAENEGTLGSSFEELAKNHCGVPTIDVNGKEMTTLAVVKRVYDFFRDRKSEKGTLMVFDNAERSYNFDKFLPIYDSSTNNDVLHGKIRILITSREQEWSIRYPEIKLLLLKEFNPDDAINFVKNGLKPHHSNEDSINDLVKTLQYYPLALEQAVAYIKDEKCTRSDYSVVNYLKEYEENSVKLLDNDVFKEQWRECDYEKTTYTTWNMTFNKISKLVHGELSVKIINIIAFIAPIDINREIFFRLKDADESDVRKAVRLVVKYSIINGEEGHSVLNVHRLVQQVTRLQLRKAKELEKYLDATMELMESWLTGIAELEKLEEIVRIFKFILRHIEALAVHLSSVTPTDTSNAQLKKVISWLAQGYHLTYDFRRLENVLERSIEIDRILKGNNTIREAHTLEDLADVYMELGNYHESINAREQALSIFEVHKDQTMMAELHSKIANTYRQTSEKGKSREHYYKALEILDGHAKGNDPHVVINKLSICLSLRLADDSIATTELLEKNLTYWKQFQGEIKYRLSPKQFLDLGEAYMRTGDKETGSEYFIRSLEMCEVYARDLHYARMIGLINDSNVKGNLGLDLESPLKKALTIIKETQGPHHIETVKCIISFADFYFMKEDVEKGFQLMKEAQDIAKRCNYRVVHSEILVSLGQKCTRNGKYEEALQWTNEGLSILESFTGVSSIKLFTALETLAVIHENLGNQIQHRDIYKRLWLITQEQCKEGDFKLAWAQVRLGRALALLGDKEKSKELVEKGMPVLISHYRTKERAEVAVSTLLTTSIS